MPKKLAIPRLGTTASREYFLSLAEINSFMNFVFQLIEHIESVAKVAHDVLIDAAHSDKEREKLLEDWDERAGPVDALKKHRQFFVEVILVRHVENYLNYFSGLLYEIFTQRPDTVKSSEKIEVEYVLSFSTIEDFVLGIAEKKVTTLSYKSFLDLCEYFKDHFGLSLCSEEELPSIVEAIETRNISVHNRCIINDRYVNRTNSDSSKIGKQRELFLDTLEKLIPIFASNVKTLDPLARRKFGLRGVRFNLGEYFTDIER